MLNKKKITLKILGEAYADGTNDNPCVRARLEDEDGNQYYATWEIEDMGAFNEGELDNACDWDNPSEILDENINPVNLNNVIIAG